MPEPNSKYQENLRLLNDPRIQSLLKTIRSAEGATYNTRVGGSTFDDLSKKPGVMTRLPRLGIKSSAEGAYQFLNKTWDNVSKDLGLKDFSPLSQDIAAVELIKRRGALDNLLRGDFQGSINKLSPEWASLPTASGKGYYSGQKARRIDDLQKIYLGEKIPKGTYESFTSPNTYSHSKIIDLESSPINLESSTVKYVEPEVEEAKQEIETKSFMEDLGKIILSQQSQETPQNTQPQFQEFVPSDLPDPYNYIEADPGYNFQEFQNGGATRQDSINISNNSRNFKNAISKLNYKKIYEKPYSAKEDIYKYVNGKVTMNTDDKDLIEHVKTVTNTRANGDIYLNSNTNRTGGKKISNKDMMSRNSRYSSVGYNVPLLKKINNNQYLTSEKSSFIGYNTDIPNLLMDGRIKPQTTSRYELSETKDKEGDFVIFSEYDPIAVTPFDMLSEQQKKERVRKYGRNGVPTNYGKKINTTENKIVDRPKLEVINDLDKADLVKSNNTIGSDVEIPNQYIQPKYWDVQDNVNQNFGGYQQNYRVTPENADTMLRELAPEPFNSRKVTPQYQDGGIQASKDFTENWYKNRVLPDENLNAIYQAEKDLYVNQASDLPDPAYVDKIDDFNTQGTYDINTDKINLIKSANPLVYTHEIGHRINLPLKDTQSNVNAFSVIGQNILPKDKIQNQWVKDNYQQISNYQEVIPRLNSYRQLHGLKPDQVITPELIQSNRDLYNQGKIPFEDNTDQLYKMFENEGLSNVLNKVVSNDTNAIEFFAQDGGFIPVSENGMYEYPNQKVLVPTSGNITMKEIEHPILGISQETGEQIMMQPGQEYFFENTKNVLEIPVKNKKINNRFK